MSITPDTKDWTWVIDQRCGECGFASSEVSRADVPTLIRDNAVRWADPLGSETARQRPRPDVWSPVEYACHVRDVHRLYDARLAMMLAQNDPEYPNWDQDETAISERYADQDPAVVLGELRASAEQIALSFEALDEDQWQRTGRRSDGAAFTVDSFARYYVHDFVHHMHDVTGR